MAAAAGAASILEAVIFLRGVEDVIGGIRQTAGQFDTLRDAAGSANDAIAQIRGTLNATGGSAGQAGGLAGQFRAIGLSIEELRTTAHEFRERLFSDPLTIGSFGRQVVPARLGGPSNELETLDRAIKMLRDTKNAEDRLSLARRLGLQTLLPLADLSEREYQALRREGERRGAMIDDDLRQLRATSEALQERRRIAQEERGIQQERRLRPIKNWWDRFILSGEEAEAKLRDPNTFRPRSARGAQGVGGGNPDLQQNTKELRLLRQEIAGGGRRAQVAVPSGLRGHALQEALNARSLGDWGAFSLNE